MVDDYLTFCSLVSVPPAVSMSYRWGVCIYSGWWEPFPGSSPKQFPSGTHTTHKRTPKWIPHVLLLLPAFNHVLRVFRFSKYFFFAGHILNIFLWMLKHRFTFWRFSISLRRAAFSGHTFCKHFFGWIQRCPNQNQPDTFEYQNYTFHTWFAHVSPKQCVPGPVVYGEKWISWKSCCRWRNNSIFKDFTFEFHE